MRKSIKTILGGAILVALPMLLTSCEGTLDDVFGEWSRPTPGNNTNTTPAASNTYLKWNGTDALVATEIPSDAKVMSASETTWNGTYIVDKDIEITGDVTLGGDVDLIIKDGFTLSLASDKKIDASAVTYTLNIYSQSNGDGAGKLTVSTTDGSYPIANNGTINIHSGIVNSTATGAGSQAIFAKNLNIYGGKVVADGSAFGFMVDADLKIYKDATVETEGGTESIYSSGGIYIYGGSVKATGKNGTRVGGGGANAFFAFTAFEISGGTVIAKGGDGATGATATGGDGINVTCTLEISGGDVTATGGDAGTGDNGGNGVGGPVNVTGGKLLAEGKVKDAGGANDGAGVAGTITFTGVTAKGGSDGSSWPNDITSGNPSTDLFIKIE